MVEFAEMETRFPAKTQNSSKQQVSDSSWRKKDSSLKKRKRVQWWQRTVRLPITLAMQADSPHCQSFTNENDTISKVRQTGAEGWAGLPNRQNLPFSGFESQSNTNSKSSKATFFSIGISQTHPKI